MMAEFGIPVAHGDDPDRAMRAAIKMITELRALNQRASPRPKAIQMGVASTPTRDLRQHRLTEAHGLPSLATREPAPRGWRARARNTPRNPLFRVHLPEAQGTYRMRDIDRVIVKARPSRSVYEVLDFHTEETSRTCRRSSPVPRCTWLLPQGRVRPRDQAVSEALALPPGRQAQCDLHRALRILKAHPPEACEGVW